MSRFIDETGNRYGKLVVIKRAKVQDDTRIYWRCRCDCGKKTVTQGIDLRRGHSRSCGCSRKLGRYIDETGNRYGRLVVIEIAKRQPRLHWRCQCDCGNIAIARSDSLRNGKTKSCGCYHRRIPIPKTRRPKIEQRTQKGKKVGKWANIQKYGAKKS